MQAQSSFATTPMLGLPSMLSSPSTTATTPQSQPVNMATFPTAFAAFASQIRNTQLQSLLQSQLNALHGSNLLASVTNNSTPVSRSYGNNQNGGKVRGTTEYPVRKRVGGSTVKTAKVWRYFDELPTVEQAAECRICRKKIKATNSSTTGMIRHLRSCHVQEYQVVQEARQNSMIIKMEEKARAKLLREMNEKVVTSSINMDNNNSKKEEHPSESQKSPSASSSASDTASSASSSHFSTTVIPPSLVLPPMGLPAPKPIKPMMQNVKQEATEVEEEVVEKPTDLSFKGLSAFSSVPQSAADGYQKKVEDDHKIHMQIALMLLLDQQPAHLIDRPGFRSLFKFLVPGYQLPSGTVFQSMIVPQLLNHMKQQIGAIFSGANNNNNGMLQQPTATQLQQQIDVNTIGTLNFGGDDVSMNETENYQTKKELDNEEDEEEENVEIEDDTSSASSSMDTDTCDAMTTFIHYIGNDTFPHDELISLLSVVSNIFQYFSTRPLHQTHLSMSIPSPTSPNVIQQVQFVFQNLSSISNYIRHTPDMQLLPLSASQETLLQRVVEHIETLS